MSEKNNIFENDLLMRTILEGGQEEVPGRVWDAVSERLDEVADKKERKVVTLWWRRAGVAVAAVAAAVATLVLVERGEDSAEILPRFVQDDMIAVAEPETVVIEENITTEETIVSQAGRAKLLAYAPVSNTEESNYIEQLIAPVEEPAKESTEEVTKVVVSEDNHTTTWDSFDDWEEEVPSRQVKTSLVLSGITGTANTQNNAGAGPLKAPSVILTPTETGIKEKENQTRYGIPVSVGAGVRLEFTPRWSLGVGLNYTMLSRTLQGTYTHINEAGSIDNLVTSEIKNNQHYLGVPVNVYFNILNNNQINFYTYAGGTVEKCLSDKYHILTNNIIHKEAVKGVQLSAAVGFGAEFMLTKYAGLYIDPSLRYYFDCDQPKSIRTAQPLMLSAEIGLRFRL